MTALFLMPLSTRATRRERGRACTTAGELAGSPDLAVSGAGGTSPYHPTFWRVTKATACRQGWDTRTGRASEKRTGRQRATIKSTETKAFRGRCTAGPFVPQQKPSCPWRHELTAGLSRCDPNVLQGNRATCPQGSPHTPSLSTWPEVR